MHITLKLFASLSDYLPERVGNNQVDLTVRDAATVESVIEDCKLPRELVHLVLVNGFYVRPADRTSTTLKEGDVLALWPPIAGG